MYKRQIDLSPDIDLGGADLGSVDLNPWVYGLHVGYRFGPVSYTHLRAHETVLDLVCRLLLENKNTCELVVASWF